MNFLCPHCGPTFSRGDGHCYYCGCVVLPVITEPTMHERFDALRQRWRWHGVDHHDRASLIERNYGRWQ